MGKRFFVRSFSARFASLETDVVIPNLLLKFSVCSRRGFHGRARLLPSRALGNQGLGRSLALPLQELTLTVWNLVEGIGPGLVNQRLPVVRPDTRGADEIDAVLDQRGCH